MKAKETLKKVADIVGFGFGFVYGAICFILMLSGAMLIGILLDIIQHNYKEHKMFQHTKSNLELISKTELKFCNEVKERFK